MEETASPSSLPLPSDPSIADLIAPLEKHAMSSMDSLVDHLRSLHQEGTLDKDALKSEVNQVSRLAQAILLIRILPTLLTPPPAKGNVKGDDVKTADLFKKIHQAADILQVLCTDQTRQEIDSEATQILAQIKAKEQQIKQQIAKKQQEIAQIVQAQKSS